MMKICIKCDERKEVASFARNSKSKDGYLNTCKACITANKRTGYSLRKAIDAKCKDCIHDPIAGGGSWRMQVESCTSGNCPLFEVRPVSSGGKC